METLQMDAIETVTDQDVLEQWVRERKRIAYKKLTRNVSPTDGELGAVLASPSKINPNYYYHWVRDAARTMRCLVNMNLLDDSETEANNSVVGNYVEFSRINQITSTPCNSLGEPKFNVDGSSFTGPWGRPQNDGPALRAITLIRWANQLLSRNDPDDMGYIKNNLYDSKLPTTSVIKTDLEFIAHHWQEHCFDLWEEVNGDHFFTRVNQRTALREGAAFATLMQDPGAADFYNKQADAIEAAMEGFWDEANNRLRTTINFAGGLDYKYANLDAAILIGSIQAYSDKFPFYAPNSDRILATAFALYKAFENLYPINSINKSKEGLPILCGIGRYPEDKYNGYNSEGAGNPWFICTCALSVISYMAAHLFEKQSAITVTGQNIDFLKLGLTLSNASLTIATGDVLKGKKIKTIADGLTTTGDAFLRRIHLHAAEDGSLSEEFDRTTGLMTGAVDLTWSYAELITTANWKIREPLQF